MTSARAAEALASADAVIHLACEIGAKDRDGYQQANVEPTRRVVDAPRVGQARRFVFTSFNGADPDSDNLVISAKGQAERLLLDSGVETVIFRCQIIAHRPGRPGPVEEAMTQAKPGAKVPVCGTGRNRVRPVMQDDVMDAVLAAADGVGKPGVYYLVGPDEMTVDELVGKLSHDLSVPIAQPPAGPLGCSAA